MADTNLESPNHEMSVNLHVDPNISTPIVAILMDTHLRSMIIDMSYYYIRWFIFMYVVMIAILEGKNGND